jgi:Flp pilus assembly protein TadG
MHRFIDRTDGATAAEFALVLPAVLLMLFGIIDVGRYAWQLNEFEKATQMGARYAAVTNVASVALADPTLTWVGESNCGGSTCVAGVTIDQDGLGTITCTSASCSLTGNFPGTFATDVNPTAFANIVARMRVFQSRISQQEVQVAYSGSGIGFAGDPNKPEVAPIVTVQVAGARFSPITLALFGGSIPLPNFSYSLTLEDGEGTASN